jgi:hypothetical protein
MGDSRFVGRRRIGNGGCPWLLQRGALDVRVPSVLARFGARPERWALRVKAIGSGYWRCVGDVDDLIEKARQLQQRWVKGVGTAARLAKAG